MQALFATHHSIGSAILTLETDIYKKVNEKQSNGTFLQKKTKEVETKEPVSIFAIAKKHNLNKLIVAESDISSYWKFYKGCKEFEIQGIYGIKLEIANDLESDSTASNIIIFLKNSQAYYDIVMPYSMAASTKKSKRITWDILHQYWTPNFALAIPFYSSFIARNLMRFQHNALPNFKDISPTFLLQSHGLPFDEMIKEATLNWCEQNQAATEEVHQVYYYKNEDVMKHQTIQCLQKMPRTNWDKPNLDHYASDQFSFESFLDKIGGKL